MTSLVKVDSKGRITIPQPIREALGIQPGMLVVLIADIERGELVVSPVASSGDQLYTFEIEFRDVAGSLAKLLAVFAGAKADILASRCASIIRGETAGCTIVADFSKAEKSPDKVAKELEALDVVNVVRLRKFETFQ
jgi:AbrB family looped-hinge helix DNA binding protein